MPTKSASNQTSFSDIEIKSGAAAQNSGSFSESDLKNTQNLLSQGFSINEISEISSLPFRKVIEQLETLIAAEKIDNLDILISDSNQKSISSTIENLQIQFLEKLMNSIVIEKSETTCSEEEVRLMKALIIAKMKRNSK